MSVGDSKAILNITWRGLENRKIGYHKGFRKLYEHNISYQDMVRSKYEITTCADIKKNLIHDVHTITMPLFEAFK